MKHLTTALIGATLVWGLSGCAYHHSDFGGYYTSGYPYSRLHSGAIYSSYPAYRPYAHRTWLGGTAIHGPSGYGAWPVYPHSFFGLSFRHLDHGHRDHDRFRHDKTRHHGFAPAWGQKPRVRDDRSGTLHRWNNSRHERSHDSHRRRDGKIGQRHGEAATSVRAQPVVHHDAPRRDHGVTIEYRQQPRRQVGGNPAPRPAVSQHHQPRRTHGVTIEHRRSIRHTLPSRLGRSNDHLPRVRNPVTLPSSLPRSLDTRHRLPPRHRLHKQERPRFGDRSLRRAPGHDRGGRSGSPRMRCAGGRC